MTDRRATMPQFPLIPLALGFYLLSVVADAVGLVSEGGSPWDKFSFLFMVAGTITALRAAVPSLEDLLSFRRSTTPLASGALVAYAFGAVALCIWGGMMRESDPTSHIAPLLATIAATTAVFAFGHVAASRTLHSLRSDGPDLSATQRIARASLNF